jgi:ribulose-phosphate 3-epimerase
MIVGPERWQERIAADHVPVPCELSFMMQRYRMQSRIRDLGKKVGVVLHPASPIACAEEMLHLCDIVLVMSVGPGFGGQDGGSAPQ